MQSLVSLCALFSAAAAAFVPSQNSHSVTENTGSSHLTSSETTVLSSPCVSTVYVTTTTTVSPICSATNVASAQGSSLPGKNPYGGSSKTCNACNQVSTVTTTTKVSATKTVTMTSKGNQLGSSSTSGSETASQSSTTSASPSSTSTSATLTSSSASSAGSQTSTSSSSSTTI